MRPSHISIDIITMLSYKAFLMRGYLAIKNVGIFAGRFFGWQGPCSGEIAHFRSLDFCWDILTDPAYHRKIVITDRVRVEDRSPLFEDSQSFMPHLTAIVFLGPIIKTAQSPNPTGLEDYLASNKIAGFIPDRKELLYDSLKFASSSSAGLAGNPDDALDGADNPVVYDAEDLKWVSAPQEYFWDLAIGSLPREKFNIVVWDFGTAYGLLRTFRKIGCRLRIVPPNTDPEDIVALHPDGIIISGSPLSPSAARRIIPKIERVIGIRPVLGVGGGAVSLAQAMGIEILDMEKPHHGSAIPIEEVNTGRVSATYQAHSLSLSDSGIGKSGCLTTHFNVCDDSVEGFVNHEYETIGALYSDVFQECPPYLDEFTRILEKSLL